MRFDDINIILFILSIIALVISQRLQNKTLRKQKIEIIDEIKGPLTNEIGNTGRDIKQYIKDTFKREERIEELKKII